MRRALALLAVFGLAVVSCGDDGASSPSTTVSTASSTAPSTAVQPGGEAPEALQLSAPLVGGGTIDLTQYAGTTVALWFWAPT